MCIIERDGKVVIIDQTAKIAVQEASLAEAETLTKRNAELMNGYLARIDELETGLDEAVKVGRQNAGTISALRVHVSELEAEVKRLSEPNACDDWGNPVVLSVSGGKNCEL